MKVIRGGWLKPADSVAWADKMISESSKPNPSLLDVALGGDRAPKEMALLLEAIPGSPNTIAVIRRCLGDLLKIVEQEPTLARDAARWIKATGMEGRLPASEFGHEPMALDDAFALAEENIVGTVEAARERLLAFLREHRRNEA